MAALTAFPPADERMIMQQVYIDTATGTWGSMDDLVILDPDATARFLSGVEDMSDSEITAFGNGLGDALTAPDGM